MPWHALAVSANVTRPAYRVRRPQLCLQADAALMPFLERFRLCLQLGQEVDFAKVQGGTIGAWLVSVVCCWGHTDAGQSCRPKGAMLPDRSGPGLHSNAGWCQCSLVSSLLPTSPPFY